MNYRLSFDEDFPPHTPCDAAWLEYAGSPQHTTALVYCLDSPIFLQVINMSNPFGGYYECLLGRYKGTRFHALAENCKAAASTGSKKLVAKALETLVPHIHEEPAKLVLEIMYEEARYHDWVRQQIRSATGHKGSPFVRRAYSCALVDPKDSKRVYVSTRDRMILRDIILERPFKEALGLAIAVVADRDPLHEYAEERFGKLPKHIIAMAPVLRDIASRNTESNEMVRSPSHEYSAQEVLKNMREVLDRNEQLRESLRSRGLRDLEMFESVIPNMLRECNIRGDYMRRKDFVRNFGWCIPNARMIEEVAYFIGDRRALSVGAGRALFEFLLHDRGVNIVATDSFDDAWRPTHELDPFMPVHEYSAAHAVRVFDPDVLVLVWPLQKIDMFDASVPMASDALRAFRGHRMVYVGESSGGFTGDPDFHDMVREEWRDAQYVEKDINADALEIERWSGVGDRVRLLVRRH